MKKDTMDYKLKIAVRNYTLVLLLMIATAFVAKVIGNSNEVILIKLSVVPFFFLSLGGLKAIYRYPIVEHKLTLRAVEYTVLDALLFALFLFFVTWDTKDTLNALVVKLGTYVTVFLLLKIALLYFDVRRLARSH